MKTIGPLVKITSYTKKELIDAALREFVQTRKMKDMRDLKGKIKFSADYDYKKMRAGHDPCRHY